MATKLIIKIKLENSERNKIAQDRRLKNVYIAFQTLMHSILKIQLKIQILENLDAIISRQVYQVQPNEFMNCILQSRFIARIVTELYNKII